VIVNHLQYEAQYQERFTYVSVFASIIECVKLLKSVRNTFVCRKLESEQTIVLIVTNSTVPTIVHAFEE